MPSLDDLWTTYLTAAEQAASDRLNWRMVKGSVDEATIMFQRYYASDRAKDAAYQAWVTAYRAAAR